VSDELERLRAFRVEALQLLREMDEYVTGDEPIPTDGTINKFVERIRKLTSDEIA
jgi:hypothetical protein